MPLTQPSVFRLVNSGFDINAADEEGQTLLIYSLRVLELENTSYLLKQGAKRHVKGSNHAVFDLLSAKLYFNDLKKRGHATGKEGIFEKLFKERTHIERDVKTMLKVNEEYLGITTDLERFSPERKSRLRARL